MIVKYLSLDVMETFEYKFGFQGRDLGQRCKFGVISIQNFFRIDFIYLQIYRIYILFFQYYIKVFVIIFL